MLRYPQNYIKQASPQKLLEANIYLPGHYYCQMSYSAENTIKRYLYLYVLYLLVLLEFTRLGDNL